MMRIYGSAFEIGFLDQNLDLDSDFGFEGLMMNKKKIFNGICINLCLFDYFFYGEKKINNKQLKTYLNER